MTAAADASADAGSIPLDERLEKHRVDAPPFEEKARTPFLGGLGTGTSHLAGGLEVIAAGLSAAMRRGDPMLNGDR